MAACKYCDREIEWWHDDEGKWTPLNEDGTRHSCRPSKTPKPDPYKRGYEAGYAAGVAAGIETGRALVAGIRVDAALLTEIVRLTHPDRHPPERFEAANRVTAKLNGLIQGGDRR